MRQTSIKAAHALLACVLAAAPFVVMLALPVFDWGVFRQVETASVGLHVIAALSAAALLALGLADDRELRGAVSPAILGLAALAVAGAVLAPFSDDALRSLHGTLEHGVGAFWFAECALIAYAAAVLRRRSPAGFAVAAASGAASVVACAALQVAALPYGAERMVPYDFREYLGLHALLAAVPLLAMGSRRWDLAAVALVALGLAASGNRGAALAALAAVAAWALLRKREPATARRWLAAGAAATAVLATVAVWAAQPRLEALAVAGAPADGLVASTAPLDRVAVQQKPYGTVWGRSVMARLVVASLAEHPSRLATGRGFGEFETVAIERSRDVPGRRFVAQNDTGSRTYWDGDQKARHHSHNLLLEAVLSAGLAGGAAWLVFLAGIGLGAAPGRLAAATLLASTLALGGSLWFLVNAALPLVALAVGALARPPSAAEDASARPAAAAARTAGFALGMVAASGLAAVSSAAARGERLERAYLPLLSNACVGFSATLMPNRQMNTNLYRIFVRTAQDKPDLTGRLVFLGPRLENAANFSCLMRTYAEEAGDVEALETSLRSRVRLDDLLGRENPLIQAKLRPDFEMWVSDVERMLDRAPGRTELVTELMGWAQARGDASLIRAASSRLLPRVPEGDPVRAYALSIKAQAEGDDAARRRYLGEALDRGLANLFPVPAATVQEIRSKEAAAR